MDDGTRNIFPVYDDVIKEGLLPFKRVGFIYLNGRPLKMMKNALKIKVALESP